MTKNQNVELEVNKKAEVALENVIEMNISKSDYFESFCEELEMMGVNDEIYDYSELFEQALLEKNLIS